MILKEWEVEFDTINGTQVAYVFADDIASAIQKAQRTWSNIIGIGQLQSGTIKSMEKLGGLSDVPFGC